MHYKKHKNVLTQKLAAGCGKGHVQDELRWTEQLTNGGADG